MSEPEMPDMLTRILILSSFLHQDCACQSVEHIKDDQKCSKCMVLNELRYCWPFDYLSVADAMIRKEDSK